MDTYHIEYGYLAELDLREIVQRLNQGQLAILPTDSVYTLACKLSSKEGIYRLCKLVGKKPDQAQLSIICSDFSMIAKFTAPFSNASFRFMKSALPGPYTFILAADMHQTKHWENKRKTIGVRIPDQDFLPDLVREVGEPLICSSLHSEDEMKHYFTEPENIIAKFSGLVDLFVENGAGGSQPSTIVDCTSGLPELMRAGMGKWPL